MRLTDGWCQLTSNSVPAFGFVPARKYEQAWLHRRKVLGCFKADAGIASNDQDGLACEVALNDGGDRPMVVVPERGD